MNITIALGLSIEILRNFAGENVTEDRESIIQTLVVHRRGKTLDVNIAKSSLAE
jgi:hypothetical protein